MRNLCKLNIKIIMALMLTTIISCSSSKDKFEVIKSEEFAAQPVKSSTIITENDITYLPECVQKYLRYTGALGKVKPQNVYIEFDADMFQKKGDKPMKSTSIQYNFFEKYTRIFYMKASKMLIPFYALHIYKNEEATFQVKVADLIKVVDEYGDGLTKAETVTLLNDICVFAPGALIDSRITWNEIDSLSTKVTLNNGKFNVSAILYFNYKGELINFISDDRLALEVDGSMKPIRWTTPISNYKEFDGRMIPTYGEAIWNYPDGDFTYGIFSLKKIKYNN